jgi:non-ribosomal peptide synthetase component F
VLQYIANNLPSCLLLPACCTCQTPLPKQFCLQAGGCYVPLDPEYPDDRLVCYMEDSKAAVLITQREHNSRAQQLGGADAIWKVRAAAFCSCVILV